MPGVNQGGTDAMSNCAMCTIAAIVGKNTVDVATFLGAKGQSDEHLAAALKAEGWGKVQQQAALNGMIREVERMMLHNGSAIKGYQFGFPGHYKNLVEVKDYMRKKKVGTPFAVWGYQTKEMEGLGAHWNFATTIPPDKRVEFRDYQDNTSATSPAATSDAFIAPRDAREESGMYNSFIVLSFEAKP